MTRLALSLCLAMCLWSQTANFEAVPIGAGPSTASFAAALAPLGVTSTELSNLNNGSVIWNVNSWTPPAGWPGTRSFVLVSGTWTLNFGGNGVSNTGLAFDWWDGNVGSTVTATTYDGFSRAIQTFVNVSGTSGRITFSVPGTVAKLIITDIGNDGVILDRITVQPGAASVRYVRTGVGLVNLLEPEGQKITIDTAVVPTVLRVSAMLSVGALAPGACYNGQITAPGAAHWDTLAPGWPPLLPDGLTGIMWVKSTGWVAVRICNGTVTTTAAITDQFAAALVRLF